MPVDLDETRNLVLRDTLHPQRVALLNQIDFVALSTGIASTLLDHAIRESPHFQRPWEFGAISFVAMLSVTVTLAMRHRWSLAKSTLFSQRKAAFLISGCWLVGLLLIIVFGPILPGWASGDRTRWDVMVALSELAIFCRSLDVILRFLRQAAAETFNPAVIVISSFLGLIAVGTALLMLPRARVKPPVGPAESAPFVTALFTATSATCVTGLIVEDTPTYWSREGQCVILVLFQIGGLGIMTFGAFFGLLAGQSLQLKEHANLGSLLESEGLGDIRRLLMAILGFTLVAEGVGALFLLTLWPDHSFGDRMFLSLFHSTSAFCNAGFALTPNSFVGMAHRWQVWGILAGLIIVGGLGFSVLNDLVRSGIRRYRQALKPQNWLPNRRRIRMALTTRLVFVTTCVLLFVGTLVIFLLERAAVRDPNQTMSLADAWFQAVTFRTAGFNTVELGSLHPSTKLVAILLMFVGASPGSTGGGIKTVVFAIAVLGMVAMLRGRDRIECFGRTLPTTLVQRAMAVMFLSLAAVMATTILIMLYEDQPAYFLDYLFEAVSAVGTVGVSSSLPLADGSMSSVTQSLSTPSRLIITAAMFIGRVGPLTVVIALGGRTISARYNYPEERVTLG